jgi:hypothetical protein
LGVVALSVIGPPGAAARICALARPEDDPSRAPGRRDADSKMTLDVYAQLEQRVKREHGARFDALVRDAQGQLYSPS